MITLDFVNPEFHEGTNLTVRLGRKWASRNGALVNIAWDRGDSRLIFPVDVQILSTLRKFSDLDDINLRLEHDPKCTTVDGLREELSVHYPLFDPETSYVSLVFFSLVPYDLNNIQANRYNGKLVVEKIPTSEEPDIII